MRTIEFRAWDKEKKKWRPFYFREYNPFVEENDCVLMQFTGLKDKNGKEIYEGDILAMKEVKTYPRPVVWAERWGRWMLKGKNKELYSLTADISFVQEDDDEASSEMEIIGNIYENPELLK